MRVERGLGQYGISRSILFMPIVPNIVTCRLIDEPHMNRAITHYFKLETGHVLECPIASSEGQLHVGQQSLADSVQQAGGSPCYLYDMAIAKQQIARLREQLPSEIGLYYAVKANPNPQVLAELAPWVDGVDIASGGELEKVLDAGFEPEFCGFAGPSKSLPELHFALQKGVHISVESLTEMKRIIAWAEQHQQDVSCGIRINPAFELRASGMHMGGGSQPFGIDEEQLPAVIDLVKTSQRVTLSGLHIYAGSQCLQVDALLAQYRQSLACFQRVQQTFSLAIQRFNLGGGLGVPYFPNNQPLNLAALGKGITALLEEYKDAIQGAELILELGRYVMAPAGYYVCQINDLKISRGETFAMLNGGLHHHLANSGNLGQLLRKNYPVVIGNKLNQPMTCTAQLAGPLCTPLDVVAQKLPCPTLEIGDYVVVLLSGAYGLSASPIHFLSQPMANELVIPALQEQYYA